MARAITWAILIAVAALGFAAEPEKFYDSARAVFPGGTRTGPRNCNQLDPHAPDGARIWCAPGNGGQGCLAGSDPCVCTSSTGDDADVIATRDHGRWRCDDANGGCFSCSDIAPCETCPAGCAGCVADDDSCTTSRECCSAKCLSNGMCGECVPVEEPCSLDSDCCTGICIEASCSSTPAPPPTSTTTTTVTTTSTTGASSTTSTSSSTSTSTSLAVPGAMYVPYTGTAEQSTTTFGVANRLICAVQEVPAGFTASKMAAGYSGSGTCSFAVYANDDAGAKLGSITGACPAPGILEASVTPFALGAGALYRFCVCASQSGTEYLSFQTNTMTSLIDVFSVAMGAATNPCTGSAVLPSTTGALTTSGIITSPQNRPVPFVAVEQ